MIGKEPYPRGADDEADVLSGQELHIQTDRLSGAIGMLDEIAEQAKGDPKEIDGSVANLIEEAQDSGNFEDEVFADSTGFVEVGTTSLKDSELSAEALSEAADVDLAAFSQAARELSESGGEEIVAEALEHIDEIELRKKVETSANFQGNWTEAQTTRTSSADFTRKFNEFTERGAEGLKDISDIYDRQGITKDEYLTRTKEYPDRHEEVTSHVGYEPSSEFREHAPSSLGFAEYENRKVVLLSDAESLAQPLTDRQKDIIAAHEMYHALVNPKGDNVSEIRSGFNFDEITKNNESAKINLEKRKPSKYMRSADELTARMAQVKNYFGMSGDETFTQVHLDHAREHYVEDTGLDNSMTLFFKMIDDEPFVRLMNELPV